MGQVYEEITLKNVGDVSAASRGYIKELEIRETTVRALVDTGAITLVISETMRKHLGLEVKERRETSFGNDTKAICTLTGPVEVHWKDRSTICQALVTADLRSDENGGVLLGAIPLEGMDLMVNPVEQKLAGIHGDKPVCLVM